MSIIFKSLSVKERLYCCFVDYTIKAFDSVQRVMLWYKLYHISVRCKLLQVIKSMYLNVTTCVQVDGFNYFTNELGLIQGEVLSPILFSLYVNDCEMAFINSTCSSIPLEVKDLNLFLLMYADDVVIFSESISGLQNMLDTLYEYTKMYV
jgi:hypothetical protein